EATASAPPGGGAGPSGGAAAWLGRLTGQVLLLRRTEGLRERELAGAERRAELAASEELCLERRLRDAGERCARLEAREGRLEVLAVQHAEAATRMQALLQQARSEQGRLEASLEGARAELAERGRAGEAMGAQEHAGGAKEGYAPRHTGSRGPEGFCSPGHRHFVVYEERLSRVERATKKSGNRTKKLEEQVDHPMGVLDEVKNGVAQEPESIVAPGFDRDVGTTIPIVQSMGGIVEAGRAVESWGTAQSKRRSVGGKELMLQGGPIGKRFVLQIRYCVENIVEMALIRTSWKKATMRDFRVCWDISQDEPMPPACAPEFQTFMIAEAAGHVRNLLIKKHPGDVFDWSAVLSSIAGPVKRQDCPAARREWPFEHCEGLR
ncbi:unnamed protein product, partial [Prorocentrum cordatum]